MFNQDISQEMPGEIRLAADFSVEAIRRKITNPTWLYCCLRSMNSAGGTWGSGVLPLAFAINALCKDYGFSRRTIAKYLAMGNGGFWRIEGGNIYLKGIRKIFQELDIVSTDRYFRVVPDASLFTTPKKRTSQLYASQFTPAGRKGMPITRAYITKRTGLTHTQQRRYEVEAGIHRTPSYAFEENADGTIVPQMIEVKSESKRNQTVKTYKVKKRLGNIYNSRQQPSCKGILKRCGRSSKSEGTPTPTRVFFTGIRRLIKTLAKRRGYQEGYYLLRPQSRHITGRLEWCLESIQT